MSAVKAPLKIVIARIVYLSETGKVYNGGPYNQHLF